MSFEVYRGEVFGLVGSAGSGKSTTLGIIAGHLGPTAGKVSVFGSSPRRAAIKRRIGYLPETTRSDPSGLLGSLRERFAAMLDRPKRAAPSPRQSRARIAQILVKSLDLVVLYEPFFALDSAARGEVKDLILKLARAGKTVILSSETLSDVKDICGRVAVYYGGKVEAIGTFDELLASPNAVRYLSPVLPTGVLERLLRVIRENLSPQPPPLTLTQDRVESESLRVAPPAETESANGGANKLLTSMTRKLVPAPSDLNSSATTDPIDHERLAELTRPSAANQPGSRSQEDGDLGPKK